jgi:hypothetical protein
MFDPAIAQAIPGLRGVGLWLVCVGLGFAVGWCLGRWWFVPAIVGAALGGMLIPFANVFEPKLPGMGWSQAPWLLAAIAVEAVSIVWVIRHFSSDEDRLVRALLLAVAAHFVLMIPAFGWPMAAFTIASLLLAGLGWRARQHIPRLPLCLADSALKLGFGGWMVALTTTGL